MRKIVIILALLMSFSSECFAEVYNNRTYGKWDSYTVENELGKTCAAIYSEALNDPKGNIYTILRMYRDKRYTWQFLVNYKSNDEKYSNREVSYKIRIDNKKLRTIDALQSYDGKAIRVLFMCGNLDSEIFDEMKAGDYLRIKIADDVIFKFSLSGFTASYERCCKMRDNASTFDSFHNRKEDKDFFEDRSGGNTSTPYRKTDQEYF